MMKRSTATMVTFRHPFILSAMDGPQPAGTYRLITEEEQIQDVSFVAFQRVATLLHIPANPRPGALRSVVEIDPAELAAVLAADAAQISASSRL